MKETDTQKNFYCLECNEQFSKDGDCPHCIDEPLLPLDRTQVRSFIHDIQQAKSSIFKKTACALAYSLPIVGFLVGCGWFLSQLFA